MSCRTTQAGSAFTSYARLGNGSLLSDVATLSTFHHLRNTYNGRAPETRRVYTDEEYRALLQRQIERTTRNRDLTDARRESILARLNTALADPTMPEQSTLYALFNLNPTVRDRGRAVDQFARQIAAETDITRDEAFAEYNRLEAEINDAPGRARPETYTEENIAAAAAAGIPDQAGSVHAFVTLRTRAQRLRADRALTEPQRIERTIVANPQPYEGFEVLEHGYDARNGRLEVVVRDASGTTTRHAYRDYPQDTYNGAFHSANGARALSSIWATTVRGNATFSYASQIEADLDSRAPRCNICGQFANSAHACPQIAEPRSMRSYNTASRWSRQRVDVDGTGNNRSMLNVSLPAIREFREAFTAGPVNVEVSDWMNHYDENGRYRGYIRLHGDTTVYRDEAGEISFNISRLQCTCEDYQRDYRCRHVDGVTTAIRNRLTPAPRTPARSRTPEERAAALAEAQRQAEEAARTDWTRAEETLAEARRTWQANTEVSYSENFDAFETVYNSAVEARATGGAAAIPYMTDNALGGMAQRGSGQAFGMEIEYEFPPSMGSTERAAAQAAIGRELYAANLTYSDRQQGYAASKQRGFRDTQVDENGKGNWSWERDGSVNGGEIVSPGLYDEPETWNNLSKVVEILRTNGAVPSKKAGAHVHVGTGMYNGDAAKYTELARLMTQHEDVIMRLASDPERGTHRGGSYANPMNTVPADGFSDVGRLKNWQGGRYRVLNFAGVNTPVTTTVTDARGRSTQVQDSTYLRDHPEFRIFDSTLDAAAMQAQVKLSVAMTHAAARIAGDAPTQRTKEELGSHARRAKARGSRRRMTSDELKDDTATFRSLLDTLFTREQDKAQMTALFANTKWNKAR